MNITLNIGLNVSKNYLPEGVEAMQFQYNYVKDYLERTFGKPIYISTAQSETEKTVVVQYDVEDVASILKKLFSLARELKQDCIAYSVRDGYDELGGALVGGYAHEWNYGIFNEAYFIHGMF